MFYSLLRNAIVYLICIVIFIIIWKINRKRNIKGAKPTHTKIYRFVLCLGALAFISILGTALFCFPFENLFIDFSSPEDVFKYRANGEIEKVIYGDNSCMIIYSDNDSIYNTMFVTKDNDSYKIVAYPQYSTEHIYSQKYWNADIYTINQTGDTYCFVLLYTHDDNVNISDNLGTEYHCFKVTENTYHFYGYMKGYDENYSVYINS